MRGKAGGGSKASVSLTEGVTEREWEYGSHELSGNKYGGQMHS